MIEKGEKKQPKTLKAAHSAVLAARFSRLKNTVKRYFLVVARLSAFA